MNIPEAIHFLIDYIQNHIKEKNFASNLDKNIIRLSHEICNEHEELGHLKRQTVRTILREKCESEVFKKIIKNKVDNYD